ncbi:MAG: amino acid permease [Bacteroidia bacterium]|nr:amino acid permease [Bacteroidia bacterium]
MNLFRKKNIQQILSDSELFSEHQLKKNLTVRDLTALGIAAIIGAGIFTTIGKAASDGGPGVVFLFIFTALACALSAFAYAEFASILPVSGSAYTYSYVAFGELFAWIIGWALIMEYAIGNITVAIGWSGYFTAFLHSFGIDFPAWLCTDYFSAKSGYTEATKILNNVPDFNLLSYNLQKAYMAWTHAPSIGTWRIIFDLPALMIVVFITWLVYRGIEESKTASNIMVAIKLLIILLVIAFGIFYISVENWQPFMPNGITGILQGVSAVFFAYIGFDAISTTAEECKNPQRDLPRGMMYSIIISTLLYVLIALVLTGMVNYKELNVEDPLAFVFSKHHLNFLSGIVSISAIVAMASVLLVFQLGQPRIWMTMSRDGLLPSVFSKIHPTFKTPSFSTIVTGFIVGIGTMVFNLSTVTDLTSIGTLFAFVLVCAGVLRLHRMPDAPPRKFKTPYINSQWIMPVAFILSVFLTFHFNPAGAVMFIKNQSVIADKEKLMLVIHQNEQLKDELQKKMAVSQFSELRTKIFLLSDVELYNQLLPLSSKYSDLLESSFSTFLHHIPMWLFWLIFLYFSIEAFIRKHSLIPLAGLIICLYMMAQIELKNWIGFILWLFIGLTIYFTYSVKNSKLNPQKNKI